MLQHPQESNAWGLCFVSDMHESSTFFFYVCCLQHNVHNMKLNLKLNHSLCVRADLQGSFLNNEREKRFPLPYPKRGMLKYKKKWKIPLILQKKNENQIKISKRFLSKNSFCLLLFFVVC